MVSVCLPSDALLQHLPSYLGFSYLGHGYLFTAAPAKHGCSSKAHLLLLTLVKGYVLITAVPDLQRGIAPLGPAQPLLLRMLLPAATPGLGLGVAPQGHRPWPQARGGFSRQPLTSEALSAGSCESRLTKRGRLRYFAKKGPSSQSYGFSSSHVWM